MCPQLCIINCVGHAPYEQRDTLDACASLLINIEAPRLLNLGCGHLLDGHSTVAVRRLAEHWHESSRQLEYILARHVEPPSHDSPWDNEARNTLLRANIAFLRNTWEDFKMSVVCLEEMDYDGFFEDNM